eukprot:symbB.v1.2.028921.t1/scaffold3113.1/size63308/2
MHLSLPLLLVQNFLFSAESIYVKNGKSPAGQGEVTCAALSNQELFSSVKVSIGDPAQTFDLVADTGSDTCIVKDCSCTQCPAEWGSCFNGRELSKSFKLPTSEVNDEHKGAAAPASLVMSFGSGDISAQVASDQVQLGAVKAYMENGLLLMVDHQINLKGHFEGILGLGRPQVKGTGDWSDSSSQVQVPSFLERAGVQRFSMCFNHNADGVLALRTPPQTNFLSSSGKVHWSLNFHGVSVGEQELTAGFCGDSKCSVIPDSGTTLFAGPQEHIESLYESLCQRWARCKQTHEKLQKGVHKLSKQGEEIQGASEKKLGLTEIDPEEVTNLISSVVAGSEEKTKRIGEGTFGKARSLSDVSEDVGLSDSEGKFELPLSLTLQLLLEHCEMWIENVDINQEMPDLSFHVSGANGQKQKLNISPHSYVLAKGMDVEVPSIQNVFGFNFNTKRIEHKKVCTMAFTATDYSTVVDGQIWIMGTPLFYEYTAHYDRGNGPEDTVGMGFTHQDEEACGRCNGMTVVRSTGAALIAHDSQGARSGVGMGALNYLEHVPVVRNLTSLKFL